MVHFLNPSLSDLGRAHPHIPQEGHQQLTQNLSILTISELQEALEVLNTISNPLGTLSGGKDEGQVQKNRCHNIQNLWNG